MNVKHTDNSYNMYFSTLLSLDHDNTSFTSNMYNKELRQ